MRKSQPKYDPAPHFITIFESELRAISWLTEQWKGKEVGGCLFGLLTRGNRIIIFLALGPGRDAIHRGAFFQQDFEFFKKTNRVIEQDYGLQWFGNYHSHPGDLSHPSGPDEDGVISITSKNGTKRWCDIIANIVPAYRRSCSLYRSLLSKDETDYATQIKLNAYEYIDPQSGRSFPAKFHVIPGTSPFRLFSLARGDLDDITLGGFNTTNSSQKIIYDRLDPESLEFPVAETDLAGLSKQLRKLPPYVQDKIELSTKEGLVIITLPTLTGRTGHIAVNDTAPHQVRAVYVKDDYNSRPVDVTERILVNRRSIQLLKAYKRLNDLGIHRSTGIGTCGYRPVHPSFDDDHQDATGEEDHKEADPAPQDRSKRGQETGKKSDNESGGYAELPVEGGDEDEVR